MPETTWTMRQLKITQMAINKMAGRDSTAPPNGQVVWGNLSSDKGLKSLSFDFTSILAFLPSCLLPSAFFNLSRSTPLTLHWSDFLTSLF